MKIGLIAPPWAAIPPVGYGGTEAVIDQLARGLQDLGCEVLLFTVAESTCPVPMQSHLATAQGMRIGACVPELDHVLAAYDAMADAHVDVIHDHTMAGPVLASIDGFTRAPVVTTNHGPFNQELNDLYRRISNRIGVISISHDQASSAVGVEIASVIHHGVDPASFPFGLGAGGYVLFLGRMTAEKGAHRAIRIARAAGMRLVIAAKMREESERRYFDAQIAPILGDDIDFVGEVQGEYKLDLLAGASALLNPIRWPEPFGMVMIEALACGTPVVTFREGAAPEIVTHGVNGYLGDTEQELAEWVTHIAEIDRSQCRATVDGWFNTRRMARAHVEVYSRVMTERATPRLPMLTPGRTAISTPRHPMLRPTSAV
jgi:glycosyltransferase involved in cell wall biosynthesis